MCFQIFVTTEKKNSSYKLYKVHSLADHILYKSYRSLAEVARTMLKVSSGAAENTGSQ